MDFKKTWWVWDGLIRLWIQTSGRPLCRFKYLQVHKMQCLSCLVEGLRASQGRPVPQSASLTNHHYQLHTKPHTRPWRRASGMHWTEGWVGCHWWSWRSGECRPRRNLDITAITLVRFVITSRTAYPTPPPSRQGINPSIPSIYGTNRIRTKRQLRHRCQNIHIMFNFFIVMYVPFSVLCVLFV
jgi:hypothetical protein